MLSRGRLDEYGELRRLFLSMRIQQVVEKLLLPSFPRFLSGIQVLKFRFFRLSYGYPQYAVVRCPACSPPPFILPLQGGGDPRVAETPIFTGSRESRQKTSPLPLEGPKTSDQEGGPGWG